eukprot:GEMP01064929.1.p1 GENE.GEMP01064929.1~~GEMP01064929.1.p1  ORF type:complete len:103 (+),score=26.57 GEMP01064929.1:293-601(+)
MRTSSSEHKDTLSNLACLVHDIGNTTRARHHWEFVLKNKAVQLLQSADGSIGYEKHGTVGAHYLESRGFSARVVSAANLHIKAKRALVTMDPSAASRRANDA